MPIDDDIQYCRRALPGVSRTFAMGIELLHDPLRDEVGIAYLICRILDTIEDTTELPAAERASLLDRVSTDLADSERWRASAREIEAMFENGELDGDDHELSRNTTRVMATFHGLRLEAREAMWPSIREMGLGMASTVRRELRGEGLHLETMEDLETYCYYVAGTVGNLLTALYAVDRISIRGEVLRGLQDRAVSFGLGLQVTNIIKNVTDDIGRGVAYVPQCLFEQSGIELQTLVDDPADPRGREVVGGLIRHTLGWLDDALEYTLTVPATERDIRMFCGLPLAFAIRTLALAARTTDVFSERTLKIRRTEVKAIHSRMKRILDDDDALQAMYLQERSRIVEALSEVRV